MLNLYPFLRPFLFSLPPETAHAFALSALRFAHCLKLLRAGKSISNPISLFGLQFPNRLGLAAGFDKNGICIDPLGALGFGFIEVGTVTPRSQSGNARPRLFRLIEEHALVNRLGFPNDGVIAISERLRERRYRGICGMNIGKNANTSLASAADDYVECLRVAYRFVDYFAINISSPNTKELRRLQQREFLAPLIETMCRNRDLLHAETCRRVPLLLKLTADLSDDELAIAARAALEIGIDGLIVSNTTLSREGLSERHAKIDGGLSGAPLLQRSMTAIRCIRTEVGPDFPLIGVGGIESGDDALAMRSAGADLVQIYTGLIYRGPVLIDQIIQRFASE